MNINGIEFEFDISDVEDLKNYNEAMKRYEDRIPELRKKKNTLEIMEYGLSMVRDFFYEATGVDVIADLTSLRKAMQCFGAFVDETHKQGQELLSMFGDVRTVQSGPGKPGMYKGGAKLPKSGARPPKK